jgi:glycosyltransferase involved in cell wall biosynthesis
VNILHAIHDFLPRHAAGSEIYAFELGRELANRHHVHVLAAEYDPARMHGGVTWRVHDGLPVIELVNNWECRSFEDTYRPPRITEQLSHVLSAVQPDIVHVHSLLNLSFDLPAAAHALGIPVVATLHDYTLVCPSGGQRLHRADQHVCHVIDTDRCARCFQESPFFQRMAFSRIATAVRAPGVAQRAAAALRGRWPRLAGRMAGAVRHAARVSVSPQDITVRLSRARDVFDEIDLFVAPSQSIADEFERLGLSASKLRVSDYGFPALQAARRQPPRARTAGQPLRIGFVGTLVWHKGVHVLLDALRRLPDDAYEANIFGGLDVFPDYVADLRGRAAGLPVHFMGAFDRGAAAGVYDAMDVLVVPSLWLENSPLVIHEAFLADVPVVGARIGGIAELIRDGENGRLYEPTSAAALAAVLSHLIDQPAELDRFRRQIPSVKPIALDAVEWETVYGELLARRSSGPSA